MDAVEACSETRLDELLKDSENVSKSQLDFSEYTSNMRCTFRIGDYVTTSVNYISPLGLAAKRGYNGIVQQLINAGASVDFPNKVGYTPLMLAAAMGRKHTCILLLDLGADTNMINKLDETRFSSSRTALYYAACNAASEVVSLLLSRGGKPNILWKKHTPVVLEIEAIVRHFHGYSSTLHVLLDYCEKENLQLQLGSLFTESLKASSDECAAVILDHGYYPWLEDLNSLTHHCSYFHQAAAYGMINVMCQFLELNPHYLQEKWLVERDYPSLLLRQPHYISWLEKYRKHPSSLLKMCKSTVLAQLGSYYTKKVRYLPLPPALKKFLATLESPYDQL